MKRLRLSPPVAVLAVSVAVLSIGAIVSVVPAGESTPQAPASAPPAPSFQPASPPVQPPAPAPASMPVAEDKEFANLFANGVAFMRDGRHHEAIIVFEAARKRQPGVPEVLVNLGYLHLARKDFKSAEAAFQGALSLRSEQVNAYWGLALAYEGLGDMEMAIGAMKAFTHLEPESSAFHRKALTALWEWEEGLRLKREGKQVEIPSGSIGATDKKPVRNEDELRRDYVAPGEPKP